MGVNAGSINELWGWIIMGLGGGSLAPWILRLYWWRCNSWGVVAGTLRLNKTAGKIAIPHDLVIGDGLGGVNADIVQWLADNQIADLVNITLNGASLLDLNGHAETIHGLALNGVMPEDIPGEVGF